MDQVSIVRRRIGRGIPTTWHPIIVGGALRAIWVAIATYKPEGYASDGATYVRMARDLARGRQPSIGDLPTAFFPPGYPAALAPLALLERAWSRLDLVSTAVWLNVALSTLSVALVAAIARRCFGDRAAMAAAWVTAFAPSFIFANALVMSEPLFITWTLATFWMSLELATGNNLNGRRWTTIAVLGIASGAAALIRSPGLVMIVPAGMAIVRTHGRSRQILPDFAILLVGLSVVLAPWALRNRLEVGVATPLSTNNATALCAGNHPRATATWTQSPYMVVRCLRHSPWDNPSVIPPSDVTPGVEMTYPDEPRWYAETIEKTTRWMRAHPTRVASLAAQKAWEVMRTDEDPQFRVWDTTKPWGTAAGRRVQGAVGNVWYFAVMGCFSITMIRRPAVRQRVDIWLTALLFVLPVLIGVAFPQFRLPAMPFVIIIAAAGLAEIRRRPGAGAESAPVLGAPRTPHAEARSGRTAVENRSANVRFESGSVHQSRSVRVCRPPYRRSLVEILCIAGLPIGAAIATRDPLLALEFMVALAVLNHGLVLHAGSRCQDVAVAPESRECRPQRGSSPNDDRERS